MAVEDIPTLICQEVLYLDSVQATFLQALEEAGALEVLSTQDGVQGGDDLAVLEHTVEEGEILASNKSASSLLRVPSPRFFELVDL
jgi:hypothetical protein